MGDVDADKGRLTLITTLHDNHLDAFLGRPREPQRTDTWLYCTTVLKWMTVPWVVVWSALQNRGRCKAPREWSLLRFRSITGLVGRYCCCEGDVHGAYCKVDKIGFRQSVSHQPYTCMLRILRIQCPEDP